MSRDEQRDEVDAPLEERDARPASSARRSGGGRLRRLLSGGQRDEFNEKVAPLTSEQRDHLGQITDELMKRYTISRSPDTADADEGSVGETITAEEISAVLETVLAEAFDFGWFDRQDLPEAPELELDAGEAATGQDPDGTDDQEPLVWTDLESGPEVGELESTSAWSPEQVAQQASEADDRTEGDSLLAADAGGAGSDPESGDDAGERSGFEIADLDTAELEVAELEVAAIEETLRRAVEAEQAAARVTADTRERLTEARATLAALESFSSPRRRSGI